MFREPYLVAPGKRKNNKFWLIRGTFYGKSDNERSTGTTNEELAERMRATIVYREKCKIEARELKTFRFCAEKYAEYRDPSKRELTFINAICEQIGDRPISTITQSDLIEVANKIHPKGKGSTKNRAVLRPSSAIMHYAAKQTHKWCDYWQIELFYEAPVKKRSMSIEDARKLISGSEGSQRLFLFWLFKTGDRITSALDVNGSSINMKGGYYERLTGKKNKIWQNAAIDAELVNALKAHYGSKLPQGKIFSWGDRHNVYRWLKPLCKRLGVVFTPHMARHSILTWIANAGGSSLQIKSRGGHASLKSSEHYLTENLDATRDITAKFKLAPKKKSRGTTRGKISQKVRKHA